MNHISKNLVSIAALIIILAAARSAQEILLPFLLAVFISIIASAPMTWLQDKKIPAGLAVIIVVVTMISLLFSATLILAGSIDSFSQSMPAYLERLQGTTDNIVQWFDSIGISLPEAGILSALNPGVAMSLANSFLGSFTQLLSNTFLIVMTVIFMLLEASVFTRKINMISDDSGQTLANIGCFFASTKHYMAIKAVTSLITGILITIGMMLLGLDNPILWGFLAFLLNFIPTIGSIIAAIPAVLLAFLQLGFASAMFVAIIFLAVNMLIGNIIEPRVMGKGVGLSTLVVFLSMVFWGWLFGPIGMLLSIPLTMFVKIAADENESTRWMAIILSSSVNEKVVNDKAAT